MGFDMAILLVSEKHQQVVFLLPSKGPLATILAWISLCISTLCVSMTLWQLFSSWEVPRQLTGVDMNVDWLPPLRS